MEAERIMDMWESKDPAYGGPTRNKQKVKKWIKKVMHRARRIFDKQVIREQTESR